MRSRATRILISAAAALTLWSLSLPAAAHAGGLELREFTMTPVDQSLFNCGDVNAFPDVRVPCRDPNHMVTQAGAHPVMRISFAFCSAEPRNFHLHTTVSPSNNAATATGGTYTITFAGQTTAPIAFDAGPPEVKAALEALPNIGPGKIPL